MTEVPAEPSLGFASPPPPTAGRRALAYLPWPAIEAVVISVAALATSLAIFGLFVAFAGKSAVRVYELMYQGAFGSKFAWANTLTRAAPLMLTALCTALPARLGMVIIGGEGALVLGGLVAAAAAHVVGGASPVVVLLSMFVAGGIVGGLWITLAGALRQYRGVNETISSLLLTYIAIALLNHMVDHGPMWDPASLNNPSSWHIGEANMLGTMPGMDVHYGLLFGLVACALSYVLMSHTIIGFAADIVGGNVRAAKVAGLSIAKITLFVCFLGGAAAGVAGVLEVAAVHGRANANLIAGYGYTGILVAFIARQNPAAVIPVAVLLGGIGASGGLLQRRLNLPDATVVVLQGLLFLVILGFETFYGRFRFLQRREVAHG